MQRIATSTLYFTSSRTTEMYFANRKGGNMNFVHVGFGSRTPAAREDMT
jgi:hypothetical protein